MSREEVEQVLSSNEATWGSQEHADRTLARLTGTTDQPEDVRRRFASFLRNSASPRAAAAYSRQIWETDIRDVLPLIATPTLVLYRTELEGAAHSRDVADRIPDARVAPLPGAGLMPWPNDELGPLTVAAVADFMRERWARRRRRRRSGC
jgi:pimeloyl-ACP methyl ester carboxylesterase